MERPLPSLELIQRFLDGGGRPSQPDWLQLEDGDVHGAVRRYQPAPSRVRLLAHREYQRCLRLALSRTAPRPAPVSLEIVPLWTGYNEEAEPDRTWYRTHAVVRDGQIHAPWEYSPVYEHAEPAFDRRLRVDALRWRVASVAHVSGYGSSVELPYRGRTFGVVDGELFRPTAVALQPGAPRPMPMRDVPRFCQWFEFRVDGVEPKLEGLLRKRWITNTEEGELIETPE